MQRFSALRRELEGRPGLLGGLASVVGTGLAGLAEWLRAGALPEQGPPPMLLFGGMFQCYPIRNPQDPVATTLPVEQVAAETGLVFSQALSLWHSTQRSSTTFEQLVAQLRTWSEQTLRAVGAHLTTRPRLAALDARAGLKAGTAWCPMAAVSSGSCVRPK